MQNLTPPDSSASPNPASKAGYVSVVPQVAGAGEQADDAVLRRAFGAREAVHAPIGSAFGSIVLSTPEHRRSSAAGRRQAIFLQATVGLVLDGHLDEACCERRVQVVGTKSRAMLQM